MLYLRADVVLALFASMSESLLQQEVILASQDAFIEEGRAIMCDLIADNERLAMSADILNGQVENQAATIRGMSYKCERFEELNTQTGKLQEEVRQLKSLNHKLRLGLKPETSAEDAANTYMLRIGAEQWDKPTERDNIDAGRIGVVKLVREMTMWDLGDAKRYCESYIARIEEAKAQRSDDGPGTLRSSQIPAGVGVMSERPIQVANV